MRAFFLKFFRGLRGEIERREEEDDDGYDDDEESLEFDEVDADEDALYQDSRKLEYGDYNYPVVDASKEEARRQMYQDEERALYGEPVGGFRMPRPSFAPAWLRERHESDVRKGKRASTGDGAGEGRTFSRRANMPLPTMDQAL